MIYIKNKNTDSSSKKDPDIRSIPCKKINFKAGVQYLELDESKGVISLEAVKTERMTVNEIVDKVKQSNEKSFFRPNISMLKKCPKNVLKCMNLCWNESPDARPNMKEIKVLLKKLKGGLLVLNFVQSLYI